MKKNLLIVLLAIAASLCLALGITACNKSSDNSESSSSKWGNVFTIETAYAQAEELGYTGTLEEFIATISGKDGQDGVDGKDGIGIANVYIENGSLYVVLDDYTVINCGEVSTATTCSHEYSDWETALESTCTSIGYDTRICSLCGDVDYSFTAATGHSISDDAEYDVYKTTHTSFCNVCGTYISESHNYDEGGDCKTCGLGLEYQLNSNSKSYTVIGVTSPTTVHAVVIPNEHYGLPVTAIEEKAFYADTTITSVTIGNNVTSIGNYAFWYCTSLSNITISDSVTSIGNYALYNCTLLSDVTIPSSVTSIGNGAFANCTLLKYVYITDLTAWCNISFSDANANPLCYGGDLYLNGKLVTELAIPDGITSINSYAFYNCTSLTSVTIPSNVTSIGSHAFAYCTAEIVWDDNAKITKIGSSAFAYYAGSSITIPSGVTEIGDYAFFYCTSLTSITIPSGVTEIDDCAFFYCTSLTSITIPNSVISIGDSAFRNCISLTSITIPNSITSIGDGAFSLCYKLVEVYNLSNLNITAGSYDNGNVAYYALNVYSTEGGSNLSTTADGFIIYADDDTGEYYLIGYVGSSTEITLPESINGNNYKIYQYAFYNNTSLTSVTIPNSVTEIDICAFELCASLANVIFNTTTEWYLSTNGDNYSESISSSDLANPEVAARYLTETYFWYYWKRG